MKENTKYHNYILKAEQYIDEIQPWFDFGTAKPWDDPKFPWVLDNKVRREILILLAKNSLDFDEVFKNINFRPVPLLISKQEYITKVSYQWTKETIKNHLLNLEWYNLLELKDGKYQLKLPILTLKEKVKFEEFIIKFATNWMSVIKDMKNEIEKKLGNIKKNLPLYEILVQNAVEKLYEALKKEKLLPDVPNIKTVWAEQLREVKFEEWLEKNF
jgi:predicted transcriptional regulator